MSENAKTLEAKQESIEKLEGELKTSIEGLKKMIQEFEWLIMAHDNVRKMLDFNLQDCKKELEKQEKEHAKRFEVSE